jgi:hypothetical protein
MTTRARALNAAILTAILVASCAEHPTSPLGGSAARDIIDDVRPPSLVSLTFAPTSINTTAADAVVQVTARITDDLAGSGDDLLLYFYSPGDLQFVYGFLRRTEGTTHDGTYTANVTFPRYSRAGEWRLGFILLKDLANNQHFISTEEIAALGFNTRLDVVSIEDVTAPQLASLTLAPTAINTTDAEAQVQVTARITDDVSGSGDDLLLYFYGPGDVQFVYGFLRRIAGTALDGTYTATVTFPRFSQAGEWRLGFIFLKDLANNQHFISTDEIKALGFDTRVDVTSIQDVTAPQLASLTFTPTSINTSSADAEVQVTARITDDVSGSGDDLLLYFWSPGDLQFVYGFLRRTDGTTLDGTYRATVTFPRFSQAGEWRLGFVFLKDLANNQHFITTEEIKALGFNTALRVIGEAPTPRQAIQELIRAIESMGLPRGVMNSLTAPLQSPAAWRSASPVRSCARRACPTTCASPTRTAATRPTTSRSSRVTPATPTAACGSASTRCTSR